MSKYHAHVAFRKEIDAYDFFVKATDGWTHTVTANAGSYVSQCYFPNFWLLLNPRFSSRFTNSEGRVICCRAKRGKHYIRMVVTKRPYCA